MKDVSKKKDEKHKTKKMIISQENEAKLTAFMEKSPLGIFVADQDKRYTAVNPAACHMSGYTEEELLNLSIPDFFAPQFIEKGMKIFDLFQTEDHAEEDIMARKKNGETFWINIVAVRIDNQTVAFCQDITARKENEERTKELNCLHNFSRLLRKEKTNVNKILQGTVRLLPSAFQSPDDAGVRITFNGREYKTQNYEPTPWKISAPLAFYGKQTGMIEACYQTPPLHDRAAFKNEVESVLETIAVHVSLVTEQIQAEKELQKSKNQLSITLDAIGDGVIVTDASGKIIRMNPQAEKLTGWSEEEALGQDLHEVFHIVNANSGEPVTNPVYRVIKTGKTQGLVKDTMLVGRDGSKRHIDDSAAPMKDDEDKMFGVIMVFSDVTVRKNAEDSLQYQLAFEKMLSVVSNIFVTLPSDQLAQSINLALEQIGAFFQIERSHVFQLSDDGKQVSNIFEWCAEGAEAQIEKLQNIPIEAFSQNKVMITDVDSLPSLLSIPMMNNGIVFGFLGIDAVKKKKSWTENEVMLLTVVAELVSNAYTRKMAEEKVRYQGFHDGLTGLFNRVNLENEMERLDTDRQLPIAIIMADLNGLKAVNDSFGHAEGDEMLKQTAGVLRSSCRKEDIIARWGGDEFVIFLPQTTEEGVKAIGKRIEEKCKETYIQEVPISLALGFAIKHSTNQKLADVLKEADESMYKHKLAQCQQVD